MIQRIFAPHQTSKLLLCFLTLVLPFRLNAQDLSTVRSFAFGLGLEATPDEIEKLKQYDLVVLDGVNLSDADLAEIKSEGAIVLGYLSAGTIEKGRSWSKKLKREFALGYWEEWDEWYARVSSRKFRRFFIRRIATPVLEKGFNGLFLDNVDMISDFPAQTKGMLRLLKMTRSLLGENRFLFIQNGDELIERIEKEVQLDGWNREDVTSTYDFDSESYLLQSEQDIENDLSFIRSMIQRAYLVTTADYTASDESAETEQSVRNSCQAGAIPFVSDIFLTRLPVNPYTCEAT